MVLRCGVPFPRAYRPDAELIGIDVGTGSVEWFVEEGRRSSTLTTVTRPVRVELVVPTAARTDRIVGELSRLVAEHTPAGPAHAH